jgi:hypothetical protein
MRGIIAARASGDRRAVGAEQERRKWNFKR